MYLSISEGKGINIVQESANSYYCIGVLLLNDIRGNRVDTIENDARDRAEAIIYKQWVNEDHDYSWAKLTKCFRACNLNRLASDIEHHFGIPSPQRIQQSRATV